MNTQCLRCGGPTNAAGMCEKVGCMETTMNNTDGMTQDAILGELNAIYDLAVKAGCPLDQHLVDAIAGIIRERDELRERMRAAEALP